MNVRLTRHSEQLLREELARGRFHSPEEVIERALENLVDKEQASEHGTRSRANLEQFRSFLDALAAGSEAIPELPSSAFSRESIYQDHP
jgi:Arc/MetJ-type ribon-helix-helix transcriptional regulator